MADETLNLNITATLNDFAAQMSKIPGITDKEAKQMVSTLNANFKRATASAASASKRMNGEFDKAFGSIRQGAGAIFGGVVNDIDDIAAAMGGIATTVGPLGVAIGGVALGVGVAAAGLVALEAAALDAADALGKAGMPIDSAMMRSIEEANAAMGAMRMAFQQVIATLGAVFGPLVSESIQLIMTLGYALSDATGITGQMRVSLSGVAQFLAGAFNEAFHLAISALVHMGYAVAELGDLVGISTGKFRFYVSMLERWGKTNAAANKELIKQIAVQDWVDDRVKRNTARALENIHARNNVATAVKAESKAVEDLGVDYEALDKAMAESMEGMHVDQGAAWAKMLRDVGDEMTATSQAIGQTGTADLAALSQSIQTYAGIAGQVTGAVSDLVTQSFNQAANRAEDLADVAEVARDKSIAAYDAARENFASNADEMTDAERKRAMAHLANLAEEVKASKRAARQTSKAQKDAMLDAFHAQQAAAAVQATVQSAINFGSLIPAFSALGPWAAAAAGGIAATVLGTQLATIYSQAPPAFYTGGLAPGETPAVLHSGESVLNRRATQQVGPDVINAMNQGRQAMSGSGVTVVNLDGRMAAVIAREGRRRDSPMPTRLGSMYGVG
jgi:transcriptional regulator of heat shock response